MLSEIIALLFACFTVLHLTTKLTGYMSAVWEWFILTNSQILKNY